MNWIFDIPGLEWRSRCPSAKIRIPDLEAIKFSMRNTTETGMRAYSSDFQSLANSYFRICRWIPGPFITRYCLALFFFFIIFSLICVACFWKCPIRSVWFVQVPWAKQPLSSPDGKSTHKQLWYPSKKSPHCHHRDWRRFIGKGRCEYWRWLKHRETSSRRSSVEEQNGDNSSFTCWYVTHRTPLLN